MRNSTLNLPPLLIAYINGRGWTLTEISPYGKVEYTPQAFEAEYGYLPYPIPPNASRSLRRKKKEYYKHRNPAQQKRGFG